MKEGRKRVPIQRYWTIRFLLTLIIGLVCITVASAIWIRHTTLEHRLNMMKFMTQEIADRFTGDDQDLTDDRQGGKLPNRDSVMDWNGDPLIYIADPYGNVLSSNRAPHKAEENMSVAMLNSKRTVQQMRPNLYVVKAPITLGSEPVGWVVIMETKDNLSEVHQEYRPLYMMIGLLALIGSGAIYYLSRRLSEPIKKVAKAARQVKEGNYDIALPEHAEEEEVYELIESFKEMSQQLQRLEALRTELLAGVTHELKTPVTSISGLLQALDEKVVTGAEADEFLKISLKETAKMKKMVEDLLAFNKFAADTVPVHFSVFSLQELVRDFVREWEVTHDDEKTRIHYTLPEEEGLVKTDALRLHQILTNLMNNAVHAMGEEGEIQISGRIVDGKAFIEVRDNGIGISEEEHHLIFERFYRGENKKYKIGGLGLGLPFSKLLAKSLEGDLELLESTPQGTTFRITLPIADDELLS